MHNLDLLTTLKKAFAEFLLSGSRSNKKLYLLHAKVTNDLLSLLGADYTAQSLGIGAGKEAELQGRYYPKKVDITLSKSDSVVAALGVKMVMQNYTQNANNYFEGMLGETANLRSNGLPYFQLFMIPDKLPHYNNRNMITHWETFTNHYASKYVTLSQDNPVLWLHTPVKTLLFVYHIPDALYPLSTKEEYTNYYLTHLDTLPFTLSDAPLGTFGNGVLYNDYPTFLTKIAHYILWL